MSNNKVTIKPNLTTTFSEKDTGMKAKTKAAVYCIYMPSVFVHYCSLKDDSQQPKVLQTAKNIAIKRKELFSKVSLKLDNIS